MLTITRNFTVSGSDFEVDMLGEYLVEMAERRSLNLTVVSNEKFDDNNPCDMDAETDENTVWTREVRVRGSWLAMRSYAKFVKANMGEVSVLPVG